VALAEIELCGELMIAAADAMEDRLSPDRIDEVLDVRPDPAVPALSTTVPRQGRYRG